MKKRSEILCHTPQSVVGSGRLCYLQLLYLYGRKKSGLLLLARIWERYCEMWDWNILLTSLSLNSLPCVAAALISGTRAACLWGAESGKSMHPSTLGHVPPRVYMSCRLNDSFVPKQQRNYCVRLILLAERWVTRILNSVVLYEDW
jgi:hypothetical protein